MNGTTMLSPAGSVPLYLPKRSTMPARACGTMRTVFASSTMTNRTSSANKIRAISMDVSFVGRTCGSGLEPGDGVHNGGGAADRQHLDGLARLDAGGVVVRFGGPELTRELDPARGQSRDVLGDDALLADQLAVSERQLGPPVQTLD